MAGDILVATRNASVLWQGRTVVLQKGVTMAREGHPIVEALPGLFEPAFIAFESEGSAVPAAKPAPAPTADSRPDAKKVRAWAAEHDIDVPARGKIPDEVYEQYEAAQD